MSAMSRHLIQRASSLGRGVVRAKNSQTVLRTVMVRRPRRPSVQPSPILTASVRSIWSDAPSSSSSQPPGRNRRKFVLLKTEFIAWHDLSLFFSLSGFLNRTFVLQMGPSEAVEEAATGETGLRLTSRQRKRCQTFGQWFPSSL